MDLHLSWSPMLLLIVLVIDILLTAFFMYKSKEYRKNFMFIGIASIVFTLFLAFDVGTRQENLNRQKFNASVQSEVEKTDSGRISVDDVKREFDATVNQKEGK